MNGTLFFASRGHTWYSNFLQLLPVDHESTFKRSYLTRPSHDIVFGDKEVRHRKMEGSVSPDSSDLVYDWTGDTGLVRDGYFRYGAYKHHRVQWQSGTNYCWSIGFELNIIPGSSEIFGSNGYCYLDELKLDEENDQILLRISRLNTVYLHGHQVSDAMSISISDFTPENATFGPWRLCAKRTNGRWRIIDYVSSREIDYEFRNPLPYYWIDYMNQLKPAIPPSYLSEVIRETITRYTTYDTNNFANLAEIVDLIISFRNGKIIELVENTQDFFKLVRSSVGNIHGKNLRTLFMSSSKALSSGWLKYRYAYSTTKSDIEQYARAKIGEYLGTLTPDRVLRGTINVPDGVLRVKMRLHDNTAPNFDKIVISMNQYGLMPGLYNVWDLIPYSFIADWGSHLGDYLQDIDQSIYFRYYGIDELLVSVKQSTKVNESWGLTTYTWYDRYFLEEFPQWEIFEEDSSSRKVKVFRCLDALSLIVGSL